MDDLPLKKEHNNCLLGSCQTLPENSTNNRELGELNETMDAREKTGSRPLQTLLRPGEWDKVLPYVHLPQLTAHIRKGLFKRGNNETEREMEWWPLLSSCSKSIRITLWKWQKSMLRSKWRWSASILEKIKQRRGVCTRNGNLVFTPGLNVWPFPLWFLAVNYDSSRASAHGAPSYQLATSLMVSISDFQQPIRMCTGSRFSTH